MADWGKILNRGNVEDRRSFAPAAIGGISLTGVALLFVFNLLSGGRTMDFLNQLQEVPVQRQQIINKEDFEGKDSYEVFASTVLGSNNEMWSKIANVENKTYTEPKLVLFRSATESGCGNAVSEVGPHYCPLDKTIYLDETFFQELTNRFGAKGGDVAQAYIVAHEVGHHAQGELGIMGKMQQEMEINPDQQNNLSIKLELQADCFAGMWVNSIKDLGVLEPGEVHEAMDAASVIGDDRIQEKVTGYVNPESWTHGSSEQRTTWFDKGYTSGSLSACDTFR
ncbi:MAG TPA: neutral zinc metallopeptidase [Candidatus Limnocylindrales bacterium]|nr:neutral zinc metallopeptidase [Candidatus Limnocylindrales bacterium]